MITGKNELEKTTLPASIYNSNLNKQFQVERLMQGVETQGWYFKLPNGDSITNIEVVS